MPWQIIKADYDATDPTTLHDDEMIAMERSLCRADGVPQNENSPHWRALQKVRALAAQCTGDGDPVHLLPPAARASPVYAEYGPVTTRD